MRTLCAIDKTCVSIKSEGYISCYFPPNWFLELIMNPPRTLRKTQGTMLVKHKHDRTGRRFLPSRDFSGFHLHILPGFNDFNFFSSIAKISLTVIVLQFSSFSALPNQHRRKNRLNSLWQIGDDCHLPKRSWSCCFFTGWSLFLPNFNARKINLLEAFLC